MQRERLFARGHLLRFVNLTLLAVLVVQGLTGLYALFATRQAWLVDLHRAAGWALIALAPLKASISWRSLRRGLDARFDRSIMIGVSLLLAAATIAIIVLGLMWAWRIGPMWLWLYQTVIAWHWILGLAIVPLVALHAWRRWPRPHAEDFTARRGAVKLGMLTAAGVAGWLLTEALAQSRATGDSPRRRVTGSRGDGLYEGNSFPLTGERAPEVDIAVWRLHVGGAVAAPLALSYEDVLALPRATLDAELDCTLGWYTRQHWQGVRLMVLLAEAGASPSTAGIRAVSVTGYEHTFPLAEARGMLLATHVGGEALSAGHGSPLRVVIPGRRGWFWVKWLGRIDVLDDPLEVVGGVLGAPRQVLRQF